MGKIYCLINQKGGCGKTQTSCAIGHELARLGKKVLLVDADPQANLTFSCGVNFENLDYTLNELMHAIMDFEFEEGDTEEVIVHTEYGTDILPASIYMAELELKLITATQREFILQKALNSVKDKYDYILIDCPPTLGLFLVNILTASDRVLIPVSADTLGTMGMGQLIQSITAIQKSTNPGLSVSGILFTLVQVGTKDANEIMQAVRDNFGQYFKVFDTLIPYSTEAKKAVSNRMPITVYNKNCSVAKAYREFVENEFIPQEEGR